MPDNMVEVYTTIAKTAKLQLTQQPTTGLASERQAQVEPPFVELARSTRIFVATLAQLANGTAPTQNIPTTAPDHGLYNNAPLGSYRCLVPLHIAWTFSNTGSTPAMGAAGASIYAGVSSEGIASPPAANGTGWTIQATRGTGTSIALVQVAPTFPSNTSWTLLDAPAPFASAATVTGPGKGTRVDGMFVVPPRYALGFGIISAAGTNPLFCFTVIFAEVEMDLDT